MNITPELQQALTNMLTGIINTTKHIKDFTIEQAPDVIKQFLMWGFYSNLFY
jgi:hypothetical protein